LFSALQHGQEEVTISICIVLIKKQAYFLCFVTVSLSTHWKKVRDEFRKTADDGVNLPPKQKRFLTLYFVNYFYLILCTPPAECFKKLNS
jgi:hypothetical protein